MKKYNSLFDAANYAKSITHRWRFFYSTEMYDIYTLPEIAKIHDSETGVFEDCFYIVLDSGAIGFTDDFGENVDWLFLPYDKLDEHLPESVSLNDPLMFCKYCGKQISRNSNLCKYCGKRL